MATPLDVRGLLPETAKFFTDIAAGLETSPTICARVNAVFQFVISGTGSYYVDLKNPPGLVSKGAVAAPDVTLTYSSERVFNDMNAKRISPTKAILTQKLKISGNSKLLSKLIGELSSLSAERAAASSSSAGVTSPARAKVWVSDKDASHCVGCGSAFSFLKRKHHCRLCGQIFCHECSSKEYRGQRACDPCIAHAVHLRKLVKAKGASVFAEAVETNVLVHEMVSIGPSRPDAPAPDTPSRALTTFQGDALADGDAASVTNSEGREGDGQGEPAVDSSLLQSRLDALQSLVDSLQQELVVAATYEAQVPSPFLVLRESTLLSSLLMPCLLIASYLGWRLLPITLLSFAALSILFPSSWWYGWIPLLLSLSLSISVLHIARAKSMEPFRRRMFVYGLAFSMWCDYRIVKRQVESLDEQEAEVVWSLHHRRNAAQMYHGMLQLQGFWIKLGQYLSTRQDLMPEEYIPLLTKLQDSVKARPIAQVKQTIQEEFGKPASELFQSIDEKALAAASVAQVHKGVLHDGTVVAIKVQHHGMKEILKNDLINLGMLMSWITMVEPAADFKKALDEWGSEVAKELDFANEAQNLIEIRRDMKQSGLPITVPRVVESMTSQRVLVMHFIEGVKLNDTMMLSVPGYNQRDLARIVCDGVAYQLYITGVFTGDPHPGNVMVARRETLIDWNEGPDGGASFRAAVGASQWVPVLIDFGLTKRIDSRMRIAFAKLAVASELVDYGGILDSFHEMGFVLNRENASADMESMMYLFRKAKKGKQARNDFKKMHEKRQEREAKDKEDGEGKRKVEQFPAEFILVSRTVELLQGICSITGHQLIESLAKMARQALVNRAAGTSRMITPVYKSPVGSAPFEPRLRKKLQDMVLADAVLGIQVCVWEGHSIQLSVAAGKMGRLDHRPVTPNTLFPCFGVSRVATSAIIAETVNSGQLAFGEPLAVRWPAFGVNGKDRVTVADLLKCRSGVEGALPNRLSTYSTFSPQELDNVAAQIAEKPYEVLECLKPVEGVFDSGPRNPQELVSYLYYGWGWAAAGYISSVCGKPIAAAVNDVAGKYGLVDSFVLGIPTEREDLLPRVVTIDLGKPDEQSESVEDSVMSPPRGGLDSSFASSSGIDRSKSVSIKALAVDVEAKEEGESSMSEGTMAVALAAVEIAGVLGEGGLDNLKALTAGGKEHMMDPRLINCYKLKHGCVPSSNLYSTATALASITGQLCESLRQQELDRAVPSAVQAACETLGFRPLSFTPVAASSGRSASSRTSGLTPSGPSPPPEGFCMCALGGTMVFCVPSRSICVAITVNQLSAKRSAALTVAKLVSAELGLGIPVDL